MNSPVRAKGFGWACLLPWLCVVACCAAADSAPSLNDIVRAVQGASGVCVHLGGGALPATLAEGGRVVVHGLAADEAKVKAARDAAAARGLSGVVTVERWTSPVLPYADHLVNVLVAEEPGAVSDSEILRVLAPNGTAWVQRRGQWTALRQPWPKEFDEWTHWRHGADGNMVSRDVSVSVPAGVRWVAGPAQDAGGKKWYYDHVLISANGRNFYLNEEGLTARDAFNGVWLWARKIKPLTFKEVGTDVPEFLQPKTKLGTRPSKVKPVATADRLYVAADGNLLALDAATGDTLADFGPVVAPREILVEGGVIVLSESNRIRAFDAATKTAKWEAPIQPERLVAGDGRVFCMASNIIAAFDLATGAPQWRTVEPGATPATTCTYHDGVLALEKSSWRDDPDGCGILVFAGKDGRLLWQKDYRPDQTHFKEARSFFADGLLWLQMQTNRVTGFDPQTGQQKKSWISRGKHCATPVATERFFIAPECEFTDLTTGTRTRARMFKSACRLPFIPANGLLYSFPVQCECYPMLRGYMGLAGSTTPAKAASGPRLEKGPAFGRAPVNAPANTNDWPIYRHDSFRSGSTPSALRDSDLRARWSVQVAQAPTATAAQEWQSNPFVPGLITPPVIARGAVFVALPDEHRVVALDADTGAQQWSFTAGGRIDTPPTIWEDLCLFGSHDGWVYCLNAADGALAWRYRAAPQEARIMAYGQMESPWPVPGSVLVENGVAFLAAGRHPMSDGGVRVLALQARTGRVVWEKAVDDLVLKSWYSMMLPNKLKVGLDFEPVDMLVKDGDTVAMSRWRFNPKSGSFKLALGSAEYQAPGLAVPRGLWSYGIRQNKMVDTKPPAVFDSTQLYKGTTNESARVLAGGTLVSAKANGDLHRAERNEALKTPVVHDGLAVAQGRLYVAARDGRLVCLE